jgi:hypothetical protein
MSITGRYITIRGGNIIGTPPPTSQDPDAIAFLTAAGITDPTITNAINTLVIDMKTANIWTKMRAIYPMVGGTSITHKFNLVNPLDTDVAFRLTFFGGITHSSTGALPNGTNGYANTYVNSSITNFPVPDYMSFSYYSRTSGPHGSGQGNVIGSFGSPTGQTNSARMLIRFTGAPNTSVSGIDYPDGGVLDNARTLTDTDGSGFYIGSRTVGSSKLYIRGSLVATSTDGSNAFNPPPYNMFLFAYNNRNSGALVLTNKECAFAHIGIGLTDLECFALTTIVETFQTTLSRNV